MMDGGALPNDALTIVDPCAPRPYSSRPQSLAGLGGTEMMVTTLAAALAATCRVTVAQSKRQARARSGGIRWTGFDISRPIDTPLIIVINSWKVAVSLARRNPDARIFLWLHVFPGRHNRGMGQALSRAGVEVIFVSASHRDRVLNKLEGPKPRAHVAYNTIPDELRPDATPVDPDKLFFASAPHKGLDQVLRMFAIMRRRIPGLRLHLADPGYLAWEVGEMPQGVVRHGRLERTDVWRHMRESLCLFCPQTSFAETFGIVIAEANAVGTPALLHQGLGANDEVVSTPDQLLDARDPDAVEARLRLWRTDPPRRVSGQELFRSAAMLRTWRSILGLPTPDVQLRTATEGQLEPV